MEQKYRDQTCNIQQLTEEVQVFRGHRIELKRQLHQKTGKQIFYMNKEILDVYLHEKVTKQLKISGRQLIKELRILYYNILNNT